jgi:RNA polymerase sigma-70 factor (sigma-E family)
VRDRGVEYDEFVVSAAPRLTRAAYAMTGDRHAAEDLVQDVFERLYVAWPRVDDPAAYARRALVNHGKNRWRGRARRPEVALADGHEIATDDESGRSADHDLLVRAAAQLPHRQRAVVVLRFLEDLSEAETAHALGCSTGTVKSQTARAIARLRVLVADHHLPETTRSTS